jgi:RsmE family RNA methyltransferase
MNRILIEPAEVQPDGTATLSDRRAAHIREVLRAKPGAALQAGVLDGPIGTATVMELTPDRVRLALRLDAAAPPPWADLVLAVPRPKVLKRLWPQLAALGVGRVVLVNAARVERDYFDTHWVEEPHYRPLLVEGLMQAGTTCVPRVEVRRRLRPFVEDELDALFPSRLRLAAHPGLATPLPPAGETGALPLLAVGPEGGWTAFELDLLESRGFARFSLGTRILRSDTACVAALSVLGRALAAL